jgi:hypothetical protein
MSPVVRILIAVGACALMVSACGGDAVVNRCVERFNRPENQLRGDFVKKSARVWLGESKQRPEKCVAVVELPPQAFIVMRENFNPGAETGTWAALSAVTASEGSPQELAARVNNDANAVGRADGTIEAK